MISAAMSMSRIAIHLRPAMPRVRLRATSAEPTTKTRQKRYAAQGAVSAPVIGTPRIVRSGALIWPEAE